MEEHIVTIHLVGKMPHQYIVKNDTYEHYPYCHYCNSKESVKKIHYTALMKDWAEVDVYVKEEIETEIVQSMRTYLYSYTISDLINNKVIEKSFYQKFPFKGIELDYEKYKER